MNTKEETEKYYKQEALESDITVALEATRNEPGLSLQDVANILKRVFSKEEIKSLIKAL